MIELCNIQKSFAGQRVLHNFSLRIDEGCTQVLLGLSGSGKTTTLKLINGLVTAESGSVKVMGKLLSEQNLEQLRRQMGYVIQQSGLFPHYTVAENIAVVPKLLKWPKSEIIERSKSLLTKLHLDPELYLHKYPHELSGGERQRIGLARALAANPPILLMDEPFGALDPVTRQGIKTEFLNLPELQQKTVVLVTHDVKTAFELGDKVALMHQGRLLQNCSPREMLNNPAGPEVTRFLENDWLSLKLITENKMESINKTLRKAPDTPWEQLYQA